MEANGVGTILFVTLVLAGVLAWGVAFFVQRRLPDRFQGLWPSSCRALGDAARSRSDPSHKLVRLYLWSGIAFSTCFLAALGIWLALDLGAAA